MIFVLGFIVFAALNTVRIISIVSIGYFAGEQTALFIHSFAGFLIIFFGMFLILTISEKTLKVKIKTKPQQISCSYCEFDSSSFNFCNNCGRFLNKAKKSISNKTFMKLFVILLASSIAVLSVQAPIFATTEGSITISSNVNNQNAPNLFPQIPGYTLVFLYRDTAYENVAHQDMALVYGYFPTNLSKQVIYVDIGISRSYSNLHNWEVCLIGLQTAKGQNPFVNVLNSKDIQLLNEPSPLIASYLVFQNQGYTQNTLYWYEQVSFKTDFSVEQKYVRISLIVLTSTSENYSSLQPEMLTFGQTIASQWAPLQTQSLAAFGVTTLQFLLVASFIFLIGAETWQLFILHRTKNKNLKIFNNLASFEDKQVLQCISKYAKMNRSIKTGELFQYLQRHGSLVNFEKFLKILNTLEEYGFLNRKIVSVGNTPFLILKL
jgi:hypothetical protein